MIVDLNVAAPSVLWPDDYGVALIDECTVGEIILSYSQISLRSLLENHCVAIAKVILSETPTQGLGLIPNANIETPTGVSRLAPPRNNQEFMHLFSSHLREGEANDLSKIVVSKSIGKMIAIAVRDRLTKAAT
jgi:L-threonylcarbamoyladenylate synthase